MLLFDNHFVVGSLAGKVDEGSWMRSRYAYSGELLARDEVSRGLHWKEEGSMSWWT